MHKGFFFFSEVASYFFMCQEQFSAPSHLQEFVGEGMIQWQ